MDLKISNLSKTYANGVQALNGITLNISTGMYGLLGPNGAGKSTLMRTISTLQNADDGTIFLDNIDVLNEKNKVRQILGYLPQEFGLYPDVSAQQMLNHIALLKGISKRKIRKQVVQSILVKTDLYDVRKRKLGGFSGGMKQRFGIAQALIGDPKLIVVDEPTAGLDPEGRNRFFNLLSEISENIIVILSTHIVDDISQLCNQVAIIFEGKILLSDKTENSLKKLNGKVWQKVINKEKLAEYDSLYDIILTRLFGGDVLIHVYSENGIAGFEPVNPDLEDVYFATIKKLID